MEWLTRFWSHYARPEAAPYAVAAFVFVVVIARCVWSRVWVHLVVWLLYLAAFAFIVNRIEARASLNDYINGRKPAVSYVARRPLLANRRLAETDFEQPKNLPLGYFWYLPRKELLTGKYLPYRVPAQGDIDLRSLLDAPRLTDTARLVPIATAELKQMMNAGATVALCTMEQKCLPAISEVEAIVCPPDSPVPSSTLTPCYLALTALDKTQQDAIAAAKSTASNYKVIVPVTLP